VYLELLFQTGDEGLSIGMHAPRGEDRAVGELVDLGSVAGVDGVALGLTRVACHNDKVLSGDGQGGAAVVCVRREAVDLSEGQLRVDDVCHGSFGLFFLVLLGLTFFDFFFSKKKK
jgi:hypothetical protein